MKKGSFIIFPLLTAFAVLFSVSTSQAFANTNNHYTKYTVVRGNVYDLSNGEKGIKGLTVFVTCTNGRKMVRQTAKTDVNGLYTVDFSTQQCKAYDPVSATVTYKDNTQTESVNVSSQNTATMDFCFGAVSVPEFGLIPGIVATLTSVGSFLALRRKKV